MAEDAANSQPSHAHLPVAACLVAALLARLSYARHPWDNDSAMLVYTGKAVAAGARFGRNICDNKFPSAALWNAFWWRLFGAHWTAYVVAGLAMAVGASAVLATVARRCAGPAAGRATLCFALAYLNCWPVVYGGFQLETPMALFASIAAAFAIEALTGRRCAPAFICGLSAGVGAMLKPTGLAAAGALGVLLFVESFRDSRRLAQCAAAVGGLLIPTAGCVAYLYASDLLIDMPRIYRQIAGYAGESAFDLYGVLKLPTGALLLGLPLWMAGRARGPGISNLKSDISDPRYLHFALLWLALEAAGVVMQRRMYAYHFLVLGPPASLLFGLRWRGHVGFGLLRPLIPAMAISTLGVGWSLWVQPASDRLPVSDYLAAHAAPGDRIWLDNAPRVLLETGLPPASRHVITLPFTNTDASPRHLGNELLADLATHPPRYIVLATDLPRAVDALCTYSPELSNRPARAANFRAAWRSVATFVSTRYAPVALVGDRTVYEQAR